MDPVNLPATTSEPQPPAPTGLDYLRWGMTAVGALAGPAAMAVSYSRNASVPWAIAHGFIAVPYLIFVAISKK